MVLPKPLTAFTVLICRPVDQAEALAEGLEAVGAEVVSAPVIDIADPSDGGTELKRAMNSLVAGDWLVITSPNGATRAAAAAPTPLPKHVRVAAIGPGTARCAIEAGLPVHLIPKRSIAEGLLEEFPSPRITASQPETTRRSARVVLARAEVARSVLPDGLRKAGWHVVDAPAYRTIGTTLTADQRNKATDTDAVIFTSSSTVERLVAEIGTESVPSLVVSIGPATTATAVRYDLNVTVQSGEHTIEGVITALCRYVSEAAGGL